MKMVNDLVHIELAYINTSHPDFIGGGGGESRHTLCEVFICCAAELTRHEQRSANSSIGWRARGRRMSSSAASRCVSVCACVSASPRWHLY